jgi:hypothetical protein
MRRSEEEIRERLRDGVLEQWLFSNLVESTTPILGLPKNAFKMVPNSYTSGELFYTIAFSVSVQFNSLFMVNVSSSLSDVDLLGRP